MAKTAQHLQTGIGLAATSAGTDAASVKMRVVNARRIESGTTRSPERCGQHHQPKLWPISSCGPRGSRCRPPIGRFHHGGLEFGLCDCPPLNNEFSVPTRPLGSPPSGPNATLCGSNVFSAPRWCRRHHWVPTPRWPNHHTGRHSDQGRGGVYFISTS